MRWHRSAIACALLVCLGTTAAGTLPAAATPGERVVTVRAATEEQVVTALERAAHPLRSVEPRGDTGDLRPLDRMIGDARVVGLGEATHSSHDFFAMKHRVFRHLVETKGFRTFGLEVSWSTGQRLNDYVLNGKGDPRRIMRDEFQAAYLWWNNTDYLALVEWMRAHNRQHPHDPVRFMGNDLGWAGPEVYDKVTDYVARAHPELQARFTELYRGLRPTVATGTYMDQYMNRPLAERVEMAARTGEALKLLRKQSPGDDRAYDRTAYDWAVQNATVIDQVARFYSFDAGADQTQAAAAMRYRDQVMADNTAWWQEHTGTKVLVSAHNAHLGYETPDPVAYPRMQGAFLRDRLGGAYVSVGFSFDRGSFNSTGPDGKIQRFTVGPARAGTNEATLDRVRHRDYLVDLRTVPEPARAWLERARPTRSIGTVDPYREYDIALGRTHDILIHLHQVEAARLRDR
ncbi:erythromycin esterase family protein [Streptomyces spongiae]|uniref:Erythromycin esterase family protein n=1 Tax=Streptomyces spongiae TaxID=565072 RepID=A0A5N8XX52_9ACTN|nr:erythromycin esterase family protein [Streptomyces spongiae]MPY63960.1 erythromycin esterase family protein [Streptomyces spongiae]